MPPFGLSFARAIGAAALALGLGLAQPAAAQAPAGNANTFDAVRARGQLMCGVTTGLAGFAQPDSQGVCAASTRILPRHRRGDSATRTRCKFVPTTAQVRFTALQSGEVDVLSRNTTWTLSRDTALGLDFAA